MAIKLKRCPKCNQVYDAAEGHPADCYTFESGLGKPEPRGDEDKKREEY